MTDTGVSDALHALAAEDPSYAELVDMYNELRRTWSRPVEATVSRRALAQVLGELIDYLDFVSAELEKSVGLSRTVERERLLAHFEEPRGSTSIERVSAFAHQWESLERYTNEDVATSVET
jgi:hypothetical protein